MEKIRKVSEGKNYTAVNIGSLDSLSDHTLIHPKTGMEIKGKVFIKEPTQSTGTEISFQEIPPKTEIGYFHKHSQNEETYIVLKGSGYYQVDEDCFPISEGSVVRIAPAGIRSFCNKSDQPMVMIVIQAKENSLIQHTADDGERIKGTPLW